MPSPNGFDYYRRGEPAQFLAGKVSAAGFDVFRRGEAAAPSDALSAASAASGFLSTSATTLLLLFDYGA